MDDAKRILLRLTSGTKEEVHLFVNTLGYLHNGGFWSVGKTEPSWSSTCRLWSQKCVL